jgi:hypothetical protein
LEISGIISIDDILHILEQVNGLNRKCERPLNTTSSIYTSCTNRGQMVVDVTPENHRARYEYNLSINP